MSEVKHTAGPWNLNKDTGVEPIGTDGLPVMSMSRPHEELMANATLIAAAPYLLKELLRAQEFIDGLMQELHGRRISDWYPEGANNAALSMSEDMRLLGNACADFDVSDVIAKAKGTKP